MAFQTRKDTKSKPHIIIDAGPGCGKSTTCVAGLNLLLKRKPDWYDKATEEQHAIWNAMKGSYSSIGFQAFNKSIQKELEEKVPEKVECRTFHSFGLWVLRENGFVVRGDNSNIKFLLKDHFGYKKDQRMTRQHFELCSRVSKIVSLLKNNLLSPTRKNILSLVAQNNLELEEKELEDVENYCSYLFQYALNIRKGERTFIGFDDMIWLPIALNLDFGKVGFDLLICDEAQDLNPVQHELITRSSSRLICVGDPRQAIYGFRGADSMSMKTLEQKLSETERGVQILPLQTSFRLPKSGVVNVSKFSPQLKCLPDAIEGTISKCYIDEAKPVAGDLVVSRINANIFSLAFRLLRDRVPVRIQGKEFGNQIIRLLSECSRSDSAPAVYEVISRYDQRERERIEKKNFPERLLEVHSEKISCLMSLIDGCETAGEMIDTVEKLFADSKKRSEVVLLSTVHKAKGLEADRVWFLEPQLVPHKMAKTDAELSQELNLRFVAETRHKKELVYVYPHPNNEGQREAEEGREILEEEKEPEDYELDYKYDEIA